MSQLKVNRELRENVFDVIRKGLREELGVELGIDEIKFILKIQRKAMIHCVVRQMDFRIPEVGIMRFNENKAERNNVPLFKKVEPVKILTLGGFELKVELKRSNNETASQSSGRAPGIGADGG